MISPTPQPSRACSHLLRLEAMQAVEPIFTAQLFAPLHQQLLQLLRGLTYEDWARPTVAGHWRVRDIAAHLLDGDLRQISFRRDRLAPLSPQRPIRGYGDLVRFLEGLNAVWVDAFQRVSPRLLTELLERTGPEVAHLFSELDPFAPALFGVAWAGQGTSLNWFDTAREYTERWHHQQQIRDAVGAEPLYERRWMHPVIDTFLRALPHAYGGCAAAEGTRVALEITGQAGGEWVLERSEGGWQLYSGATAEAACRIRSDPDTTWRLFTKGISSARARRRVEIDGPDQLAAPFLGTLAIMGLREDSATQDG